MAATYYINPNSSGGDGSTEATSGAAAAFTSMSACEAAAQTANADLTGDGVETWICETGGLADGTACTIDGRTTTAGDYIDIYAHASHRHAGVWSDSKYRMELTNSSVLLIKENYVRVTGLQIKLTSNNTSGYNAIYIGTIDAGGSDIKVDRCIVKGDVASNTSSTACYGIRSDDTDATVTVTNCIVYGILNSAATPEGRGIGCTNGAVTASNCTVYGTRFGLYRSAGTMTATNCVSFGNSDDFFGTITATYIASDDYDDWTGKQDISPGGAEATDWASYFENYATGDFRPKSGSPVIETADGTGMPSTCAYDAAGTARPATVTDWDIGALEYVATGGGASVIPLVMHHLKQMRY